MRAVARFLLLLAVFGGGLAAGDYQVRREIATRCLPQPGERLISVTQIPAGVGCTFGIGYGRAKVNRLATTENQEWRMNSSTQ